MKVKMVSDKIPAFVFENRQLAVRQVALDIAAAIRARASEGRTIVLGLATGSTPIPLYRELIRMHRREGLSFANVVSFNLDEYYPIEPDHPQSYNRYMREMFFDAVGMADGQFVVPDGRVDSSGVSQYCADYDAAIQQAGGIDIQILGIGRTGHIGFNEPGSQPDSMTRLVELDELTRRDAAEDFGGFDLVPRKAITMGVGSIISARRVYLMAFGEKKAEIIQAAIQGGVSSRLPASYLQNHPDCHAILDTEAARLLGCDTAA